VLVVEARLNLPDRSYVHVGQKAQVKIDTYDLSRYGGIDGAVINVTPDSTVPVDGPPSTSTPARRRRSAS